MGKLISDMTIEEIIAQRERARKNYKPRAARIPLEEYILTAANKVNTKQAGFMAGIAFAIRTIQDRERGRK